MLINRQSRMALHWLHEIEGGCGTLTVVCCCAPIYVAQMRAQERDEQRAHTLESDEEDDEEAREAGTYELKDVDLHEELDDKVIPSLEPRARSANRAQVLISVPSSLQFQDGGVEVTGFNLKDEEEEGYFDKDGNFIFKKSDDHAGDVWLEGAGVYNPQVCYRTAVLRLGPFKPSPFI